MSGLTDLLRRAAQVNASGTASICGGTKLTWQQTQVRVSKTATLLEGLGVQTNDRVAVIANNSARFMELLFAIPWCGAVAAPLNTRWSVPESSEIAIDLECKIIATDQANLSRTLEILSNMPYAPSVLVLDGTGPEGTVSLEPTLVRCESRSDAGRQGEDLAMICFTGGTTGRSKGALLSHAGMCTNTLQWIAAVQASPNDRLLVLPPLFHAAGSGNALAVAALACTAVFIDRFDINLVLKTIETYGVTNIPLVATMLDWLVNHPDITKFDLRSLNKITYGASPIPIPVLEKALKFLPQVAFYQIYGQSEGGPTISVLDAIDHQDLHAPQLKSAGKVVIGSEICILNSEGNPLPAGEFGEVAIKGPGVASGYWNLPDDSKQSFTDGWLRTGDGGRIDEQGYLFIEDRIKDMIISGGENVFPAQVESVLRQHPSIIECAVIGLPSIDWGEEVVAIVRMAEGVSNNDMELDTLCRKQLSTFKCPKRYIFRDEPLPISAANKILKRELRQQYGP